jgi:hypothetical protein
MDPNETLRTLLHSAKTIIEMVELSDDDDDSELALAALELAEASLCLHHWLNCGGFLPAAWSRNRS